MLWNSITLVLALAIYPLALIDSPHVKDNMGLRLLVSAQLIASVFGAILALMYTVFLWYAALTGMYQVDTYSNLMARENPRRKL